MRRTTLRKEVIQAFKDAFPSLVPHDLRASSEGPLYYEDERYQVGFTIETQGVLFRWRDRKTDTGYGALILRLAQVAFHLDEAPKIFRRRHAVLAKVARVFGSDALVGFRENTSTIATLTIQDSERLQDILNSKNKPAFPMREEHA